MTEISDFDSLFCMYHEVKGTNAWFEMYKSWKLWQKNYDQGSLFDTIDATQGRKNHDKFSCAKVYRKFNYTIYCYYLIIHYLHLFIYVFFFLIQGSILALGTMNGFIYFYHLSNLKKPFFIADHMESVKKIEFWESQAGLRAISQCQNENIKFWDLKARKMEKHYLTHASFVVLVNYFFFFSIKNSLKKSGLSNTYFYQFFFVFLQS